MMFGLLRDRGVEDFGGKEFCWGLLGWGGGMCGESFGKEGDEGFLDECWVEWS